jgi:UDP-glucose 4-epimerase
MRIFITGASGYLGARISKFFADRGDQVFTLCFSAIPDDPEWVNAMEEVLVGDVRDENLMKEVANKKMDAIIHLVSLDQKQSGGLPSFVSSVNVAPTWSLLDVFSGQGLKQFIYFSTVHVYGNLDALGGETITESRELDCKNPYALTHALGEEICDYYAKTSDTACTILRLSNSYGSPVLLNANCWQLVVNNLCKSAFEKKKIELSGDGSSMRDFIHGDDVCRAVEAVMDRSAVRAPAADIFNVSSGTALTVLELAGVVREEYQRRYGENIPVSTSNGACDNFDLFKDKAKYTISNTGLKNIGFVPKNDLKDGINGLFSFLELNNKA